MNRNNAGITALELATTIAIVAVIAALIMPPLPEVESNPTTGRRRDQSNHGP